MSARKFASKHLAIIIMIPFIIGSHYGWYKLQQVDSLVLAEDRKKLPSVSP